MPVLRSNRTVAPALPLPTAPPLAAESVPTAYDTGPVNTESEPVVFDYSVELMRWGLDRRHVIPVGREKLRKYSPFFHTYMDKALPHSKPPFGIVFDDNNEYWAFCVILDVLHGTENKKPKLMDLELEDIADILKMVKRYGMGACEELAKYLKWGLVYGSFPSDEKWERVVDKYGKRFGRKDRITRPDMVGWMDGVEMGNASEGSGDDEEEDVEEIEEDTKMDVDNESDSEWSALSSEPED